MRALMMDQPLLLRTFLDHAARWHGSAEVVAREDQDHVVRRTYSDVAERVRRLAAALTASGVRPGDRIATLAWNTHRHLELFYAVPCIGAVCNTINPRLPAAQIASILKESAPVALFYDASFTAIVDALPSDVRPAWLVPMTADGHDAMLSDDAPSFRWPDIDEGSAAMLCYTSGSTGAPKGALYSHRALWLQALAIATPAGIDIAPSDTVMPIVPMYHVGAWGIPFAAVAMGAKLVLPGPRLDGASLVELIEGEGVTLTMAVPTVWESLFDALDGKSAGTLRRGNVGGAPMTERLLARFDAAQIAVSPGWGMTETAALIGLCQPSQATLPDGAPPLLKQGKPVIGIDARIVDGAGNALSHDGVAQGELQVRGHWVISGYYEGAGADAFTADGWLRTGDVATIDPKGYVQLVDRLKDMIKSGGEWISPVDIELLAMRCPEVAEAVAVAVPDVRWGERPLLFVRARHGSVISEDAVRACLNQGLARWQMPDRIVEHDGPMPLGATGKISRIALRAEALVLAQAKG